MRAAAHRLGLEVTGGINTGEVYFGPVGPQQEGWLTVMGPVVNLAARLQQNAQPGQILVGEATHRQNRLAFEFAPLALELKGLAEHLPAYAVERSLPRPTKTRGLEGLQAELIGRDEELAKLRQALETVTAGDGRLVSLI